MYEKHSLYAYLQRQSTEMLHIILQQELERPRRENNFLILYILYILETRDPRLPPAIKDAWQRYLEAAQKVSPL